MPPIVPLTAPVLETHEVTVTYLEHKSAAAMPTVPRPAHQVALMQMKELPIPFYRYLFDRIGADHRWVSRRYLSDDALTALIHHDDVTVYGLYKDGWPAGFAEVAHTEEKPALIRFFGVVPEAQGLGLGRWFLHEVMRLIWAKGPEKIQIETCTLDSPSALRLYQRMGFVPYDQAKGVVEWRG